LKAELSSTSNITGTYFKSIIFIFHSEMCNLVRTNHPEVGEIRIAAGVNPWLWSRIENYAGKDGLLMKLFGDGVGKIGEKS
jgi:hypothetical protein